VHENISGRYFNLFVAIRVSNQFGTETIERVLNTDLLRCDTGTRVTGSMMRCDATPFIVYPEPYSAHQLAIRRLARLLWRAEHADQTVCFCEHNMFSTQKVSAATASKYVEQQSKMSRCLSLRRSLLGGSVMWTARSVDDIGYIANKCVRDTDLDSLRAVQIQLNASVEQQISTPDAMAQPLGRFVKPRTGRTVVRDYHSPKSILYVTRGVAASLDKATTKGGGNSAEDPCAVETAWMAEGGWRVWTLPASNPESVHTNTRSFWRCTTPILNHELLTIVSHAHASPRP
jgi:hypothetical protein